VLNRKLTTFNSRTNHSRDVRCKRITEFQMEIYIEDKGFEKLIFTKKSLEKGEYEYTTKNRNIRR